MLSGCRGEAPEAQVRRAFRETVQAVEAGKAQDAIGHLAPGFRGPEEMDRGQAQLYLMAVFRQQKVGITVLQEEVEVTSSRARQQVLVLLTARGAGLLPEEASRRSFQVRWEKSGSKWLITGIQALD